MRKIIALLLTAALLLSFPAYAQEDVRIFINGEEQIYDTPVQIINGRTMVPLRGVFEKLGSEVSWNEEAKSVEVKKDDIHFTLPIGATQITLNDTAAELDAPAVIVNDTTLVPLRFISETLGARVLWNGDEKTVSVSYGEGVPVPGEVYDAITQIYDEYDGKAIFDFFAQLYDPAVGGFYYSISGRDTIGFHPDLESTVQALTQLPDSYIPDEVKMKAGKWAQSLQDPDDGYFYHPQWGKSVGPTRLGRDLSWAKRLIKIAGLEPLYPYPEDRITATTDSEKEQDNALESTPYLKSPQALIEYIESLDWEGAAWGAASVIAALRGTITDVGYFDVVRDWIYEHQNPKTGLWGRDEICQDTIGATMKVSGFFDKGFPNAEKALDNILYYFDNYEECSKNNIPAVTDVMNAWSTIQSVLEAGIPDEALESLYKKVPRLLQTSVEIQDKFRKPDGGYSWNMNHSIGSSSGMPVSLGGYESDVNATVCGAKYWLSVVVDTFDYRERTSVYTQEQYLDFAKQLLAAKPIDKPFLPDHVDCTFEEFPIGTTTGFNKRFLMQTGEGSAFEVVKDPDDFTNHVFELKAAGNGTSSYKIPFVYRKDQKEVDLRYDIYFGKDCNSPDSGLFFRQHIADNVYEICFRRNGYGNISVLERRSEYGNAITEIGRVSLEEWHRFSIKYTPGEGDNYNITVYADGNLLTDSGGNYYGSNILNKPEAAVQSFYFASFSSGKGTILVDNIHLECTELEKKIDMQ